MGTVEVRILIDTPFWERQFYCHFGVVEDVSSNCHFRKIPDKLTSVHTTKHCIYTTAQALCFISSYLLRKISMHPVVEGITGNLGLSVVYQGYIVTFGNANLVLCANIGIGI